MQLTPRTRAHPTRARARPPARAQTLDGMKGHLALLAARYETHKAAIDAVGAEREALAAARELALNDVEVLLRLRMGQDEVSSNAGDGTPHPGGGAHVTDWSDAMLVHGDVVEAVNIDIRKRGQVREEGREVAVQEGGGEGAAPRRAAAPPWCQ